LTHECVCACGQAQLCQPHRAAQGKAARAGGTLAQEQGKHHGKYVLLLTDEWVYVVVTTANLIEQHTLDGSWVQRFPR
jgi:Zn-dependent alcohol dehydrogenase